jgi:hypothetical protein
MVAKWEVFSMGFPVIRPWKPSAKEEEAFQTTDKTFEWLCQLPPEVLRQYGGKWIAAKDCQIIAAAGSMDELIALLGDTDLQQVILDRIERPKWIVYR